VPVTAKLSKLFYDRLGEAVANELVDLLNQVDATYRADLRELNELNYARFDAKLEQRLAELRSELRSEIAALGAELRSEIAGLSGDLRSESATLGGSLRSEIATVRGELKAEIATLRGEFRADMERGFAKQQRYFVGLLVMTLIPIVLRLLKV
jgi:hypothetical protein